MKKFNRNVLLALLALVVIGFSSCNPKDEFTREKVDFQSLSLEPESYWNGSDGTGEMVFKKANFNNNFNTQYFSWSGFSFSNVTDTNTPGYGNQYSAYLNDGANASNKYAVAYVTGDDAAISFSSQVNLVSASITNSTYAYHTLINGDDYSRPFAQDDWFLLTIKGFNSADEQVGEVEFYLADYRSQPHKVVVNWTDVDLSTLVGVTRVVFYLPSTDSFGEWMNTPAYFCLDNLVYEYLK